VSYNLAAPKDLRMALAPAANTLTARSLVRGAPAPQLTASLTTAQLVDGHLLDSARIAEEQIKSVAPLRPAALPGAASISRSAGIRSRR
jgi:hypothetical protein